MQKYKIGDVVQIVGSWYYDAQGYDVNGYNRAGVNKEGKIFTK